jgi:hypothetical protein
MMTQRPGSFCPYCEESRGSNEYHPICERSISLNSSPDLAWGRSRAGELSIFARILTVANLLGRTSRPGYFRKRQFLLAI